MHMSESHKFKSSDFDYQKQLDFYRRNLADHNPMSLDSTQLQKYTQWKNRVLNTYSKLDDDSKEGFGWFIKKKLTRLKDAREAMLFANIPICILAFSTIFTIISSIQNKEFDFPFKNRVLGYPYNIAFIVVLTLYMIVYFSLFATFFLKKNSIEKQFCETLLNIILN